MTDLHSTKQLTPEQFGPGLVSTSCISIEATSAVLADKLGEVRIAVAAIRTTAGLVTACCFCQFLSFLALKMDKTLSRKLSNWIDLKSEEVMCSISYIRPELHSMKFIVNQECSTIWSRKCRKSNLLCSWSATDSHEELRNTPSGGDPPTPCYSCTAFVQVSGRIPEFPCFWHLCPLFLEPAC